MGGGNGGATLMQNKQISYHRAGVGHGADSSSAPGKQITPGHIQSHIAKNAGVKDLPMSLSQKLNMKSARDRPSSNLGFNL